MLQIAERTSFGACLSIPTLDEKAWRATEPHTPNPRARLEAVAELNRAGIPTGVLIAPLMPGINDSPRQVDELLRLVTEAGATSISGIALHLRGDVRHVFMGWLRAQRPDLVPRYERLYGKRAYAPQEERKRLSQLVHRRGKSVRFVRGQPAVARRGDRAARKARAAGALLSSAHLAVAGGHVFGDLIAAGLAADAAASSGATLATIAPTRRVIGATSTSALLRSIARTVARATSSGVRVPTVDGSCAPEEANIPASRMKPGSTVDTPTPLIAQVGAQARGEAAQAELRRVVHQRARRGRLAAQRGDEDQLTAAASDHAGHAARG